MPVVTGAWVNCTRAARGASGTTAIAGALRFAIRTNPTGRKTVRGRKLVPDAVLYTRFEPQIIVVTESYDDVLAHEAAVNTEEQLVLGFVETPSNAARKTPNIAVMAGSVEEFEAQEREGSGPVTQWRLVFHVVGGSIDPAHLSTLLTDVADS